MNATSRQCYYPKPWLTLIGDSRINHNIPLSTNIANTPSLFSYTMRGWVVQLPSPFPTSSQWADDSRRREARGPLWGGDDWMGRCDGSDRRRTLWKSISMHFERALTFSYYSSAFPWGELGHGASVCDVGGGIGHVTMQLAKAHPTLQLKLQDLPERILQAKNEVWPKECPEAIQENRIEFEPIDFLSESPIKDCNVYYVGSTILFTRSLSHETQTSQLKNIM